MASGLELIDAVFASARAEGRAALMPYLMGGFPDLETSAAVAQAYADAGADLIELGAPYSDPLADGPVIHAAATTALEQGVRLDDVLAICARVRESSPAVPIVPMIYANMVLARGAERFAGELARAGAAGAIVPDMPLEEGAELRGALAAEGLASIAFVTPTTSAERRARILAEASGFVYVVSLAGVTGERQGLPAELAELVGSVRAGTEVPAAVGFGIATPETVAEVGAIADGVIVGSRLVREVAGATNGQGGVEEAVAAVSEFIRASRAALLEAAPAERSGVSPNGVS